MSRRYSRSVVRALLLLTLAANGCMLGTQYFNSHSVTKKADGEYNDMNPLGISGCKAKRKEPAKPVFAVHCRCGGGGSTEGCLETEAETVNKGFDDYAQRICREEGFQTHDIEDRDQPKVSTGEEEEASRAVIVTGLVRCR